jgi:hypothetical protein
LTTQHKTRYAPCVGLRVQEVKVDNQERAIYAP